MSRTGGSDRKASHSCAGHSVSGSNAATASSAISRIRARTRCSSHGSSVSGSCSAGSYSTPVMLEPPPVDGFSRFLEPPRLRTAEAERYEERHATWIELFLDLVFVVAIAELGTSF